MSQPRRTPPRTAAAVRVVSTRDTDAPPETPVKSAPTKRTPKRASILVAGRPDVSRMHVGVRHGDLRYAPFPVLVGHYAGDTIVSAEAALDRQMRGAEREGPLSRRRDLGLYPGPLGTHAVFFHGESRDAPRGALVVGLGDVGELSPQPLQSGVRDVLLEYALRLLQRHDEVGGSAAAPRLDAGVSALLIGTGAGSLSLRDSLEAMVRGALDANRKLEDSRLAHRVRIARLEFIELFEDVAIGAARDLAALADSPELGALLAWPERVIVAGEGWRRRIRFDDDPGWWQRLEIVEDRKSEILRFVSTTNRARAEESLGTGQLQLADAFVARACGSAIANPDIARSLFEMLLPPRLKESAPDPRDTVLLVDETSARFPWELLEDRWSPDGEPPAVAAGMVRQLKVREFRARPTHPFAPTALVVGNPDLEDWPGFAPLPGARIEAERVSECLVERGYDCRLVIDAPAGDIVDALHGDAWRILHLAGHGVHEFPLPDAAAPGESEGADAVPRMLSGMVIGRDTILTPGDVEQMRHVPELVFVNCCHLGQTTATGATPYHRLAANLGVQFVRMGVRAVVCAGWAVGDEAALTFAQTFYRHLLDGASFGDAVLHARRETWLAHPGVNTWGAYQCYGDPAFRIVRDDVSTRRSAPAPYVSPAELVADLGSRAEAARMEDGAEGASRDAQDAARRAIEALSERIPVSAREGAPLDWTVRADVCAGYGFAFGESGLYAEAIRWLDRALVARIGTCPVRAVEQAAHYRIRLAAPRTGPRLRPDERRARLDEAIVVLASLVSRWPTPERLALLAGAHKRLALASNGAARVTALREMTSRYRESWDASAHRDTYAFTNWAFGCLLLDRYAPGEAPAGWQRALADRLTRQVELARDAERTSPSFWNAAGLADLAVVKGLLTEDETTGRVAAAMYRDAIARGASVREIASVRDHLDTIRQLADSRDIARAWPKGLAGMLADLVATVTPPSRA